MIPLAALLAYSTEQLALRVGDALGGLLNATFGNAVELLIAILALIKGEVGLVQASMVGSVLSNTTLVLGGCFFAGGLRFHEQIYMTSASQLQISCLGMVMLALILPAAYIFSLRSITGDTSPYLEITDLPTDQRDKLLAISRGFAIILLITYVVYLCFQLWTHAYLFQRRPRALKRPHDEPGAPHPTHEKVIPISDWLSQIRTRRSSSSSCSSNSTSRAWPLGISRSNTRNSSRDTTVAAGMAHDIELGQTGAATGTTGNVSPTGHSSRANSVHVPFPGIPEEVEEEEEEERPEIKALFALVLLLGVTAITGVTAEFLVSSINGVTESTTVSKEFVGLILLPAVSNTVEHVCAITVSIKDKLDLSLSIAIGSSIQVALCILPFIVLVGWWINQPMSLFFDSFET